MITTPQEYYSKLYLIQDTNKPSIAVLMPSDEKIYNIDLSTRSVETPRYLSIEKDHFAETIYFLMDRYYDGVDLSNTTGIVQYINAKKESHIYAIPFYDIVTFEGKILFPWCIDGAATKKAGDIKYSFKFYNTFKDKDDNVLFSFNLNTIPSTSKILTGLDVDKEKEEYKGLASQIEKALEDFDIANSQDIEWLYI